MTNTEKIVNVTRPFVGKVITSKMLIALVLETYPETNPASILASDHAGPNPKSGIVYASQVFDRVGSGYLVRETADIVAKPKTGRSKGLSLADALAAAKALIAQQSAPDAQPEPEPKETVPVDVIAADAQAKNGQSRSTRARN